MLLLPVLLLLEVVALFCFFSCVCSVESSAGVGLLPGASLVSIGIWVSGLFVGRLLTPMGVIHGERASGVLALG